MSRKADLVRTSYPEYPFGDFTRVDGTVAFYTRVNAVTAPDAVVLDVGCGRGDRAYDGCRLHHDLIRLKGRVERVIGIDVDPVGADNPFLDEFRLIPPDGAWPVGSESVDVVVSDFVLEHLEDPPAFFAEAARVLRPGGVFCARTPNRLGYVALLSRLIPNRHHARVVGRVQHHRESEDVFPTFYRANRRGPLLRMLRDQGLDGVVLHREAEPNYVAFSPLAYRVAARVSPLIPSRLRNGLQVFARKRG